MLEATTEPGLAAFVLRPLEAGHLPLLLDWFHRPHVLPWWGDVPATLDGIAAEYDPARPGNEHEHPYVIEADGRPVGWVVWYRLAEEPTYAPGIELVRPDAVALDIAIGEEDHTACGLGPAAIRRLLVDVVQPTAPDATEVWLDPHPGNERAHRAYARLGFEDTGIDPADDGHGYGPRRLLRRDLPI